MNRDVTMSSVSCAVGHCGLHRPGHDVHVIQAKLIGRTPWGWRDAVVTGFDGDHVHLAYVLDEGRPVVWHHRPALAAALTVGAPVRLHEQYSVLGTPSGWYSVLVDGGIGPVPEPEDPAWWQPEVRIGIVDLSTGVAEPTDRPDFGSSS